MSWRPCMRASVMIRLVLGARKQRRPAPGTPLAEFHARLTEAEGRAAIGWLAKIEKVANEGDWKAAAWKLERRYPETYGRTFQKLALTTPDGTAPYHPAPEIPATFFTELALVFRELSPEHLQWDNAVNGIIPNDPIT